MRAHPLVPKLLAILLLAGATLAVTADDGEEGAEGSERTDALLEAARLGDFGRVHELLEQGVPVDVRSRYDRTPLSFAAGEGHLAVVVLLLERGADPSIADSFYDSQPLQYAFMDAQHVDVGAALLRYGGGPREYGLMVALRTGSVEMARAAASAGPILESDKEQLQELLGNASEELRAALAAVSTVPDPPPPTYGVAELAAFTGEYEGWATSDEIRVRLEGGRLLVEVNGTTETLVVQGDQEFRAESGLEAGFFGRAGGIEGIQLSIPGKPPVVARRSVADIVDQPSWAPPKRKRKARKERTVHWPGFRGTDLSGIGDGDDTLTTWDLPSGEGVLWQTEVAGLANSSPIVWGDHLFLATAVAENQEGLKTGDTGAGTEVVDSQEHSWQVLALDKKTGKTLWATEVGSGIPLSLRHFKATQSNSSPATDGKVIAAVFPTAGLAILELDGTLRWRQELGPLSAGAFSDPSLEWGFASSPVLYQDTVILQVDIHSGGYVAAWDMQSGEQRWRTERSGIAPSWATPAIVQGPSGAELVLNGSMIRGYDPAEGTELWSLGPNSELVVASPIAKDGTLYVSAGYPPVKPIYALELGVRGALDVQPGQPHDQLLWSHQRGGAYMPTPLLYEGLLYVVHHNGRLVAYDAATGDALAKKRFSKGGVFTASPVVANGHLYTGTEEGLLYVLRTGADPEEVAVHDFDEPLMATPAISEGVLYVRTESKLWALGRAR